MAKEYPAQNALSKLGFEAAGPRCFGVWNGYAVSVHHSSPSDYFDVAVRTEKNSGKEYTKKIRASLRVRKPKVALSAVNRDHFTFVSSLNKKTPHEDQLCAILDVITTVLKECGASPADTCVVCGKDHPDSMCLLSTFQPVHAACVGSFAETARADAADNELNGSYVSGTIGGILGVLVGLIPSLLSILLFDRIYSVLFALVPLCAMWGYRKLRGKRSAGSIVIVIILSLLGVVLLEFLAVAISFKQELGMSIVPAMRYTLNYLFTSVGIGVLLQESIAELLFMAIGIFLAWRYLNHTNAGSVAAAETAGKTLRPIGGSWDDPDWSEK